MLRSLRKLEGCRIEAADGDVGSVHDALLDEAHMAVRLIVIDTGKWLAGRRVLVSPVAVAQATWDDSRIELRLTREQVESSPPYDPELPVTREHESEHHRHHGWPFYWGGSEIWGDGVTPMELAIAAEHPGVMPAAAEEQEALAEELEQSGIPHLRSAREMIGSDLEAIDGAAGKVRDLLMDDGSWRVRYLVLGGTGADGDVLLMSDDISQFRAADRRLYTDLPRHEVRHGPEWDPYRQSERDIAESFRDRARRARSLGDADQRAGP